jgi:hypothetical protein
MVRFLIAGILVRFVLLKGGLFLVKEQGPPEETIKNIYRQILADCYIVIQKILKIPNIHFSRD